MAGMRDPVYDPARPPNTRMLEDLLMTIFGPLADEQQENWLRLERKRREREGEELTPGPSIPGEGAASDPNRVNVVPQDWPPDITRAPSSPIMDDGMYAGQQSGTPPPFPRDRMWAEFQEQNPGLNYDAVAQQSGGNVPGGTFSEPTTDRRPEAQSDQNFYDWVDKMKRENQLNEMMDPRANTYDPEMAKAMLTHDVGMGRNAADELYSRAQMARSNAEMQKAMMMGGKSGIKSNTGQMQDAIDILLNEAPDEGSRRELLIAKLLIANGQVKEANEILTRVLGPRAADQASEGVPRGSEYVGADGKLRVRE